MDDELRALRARAYGPGADIASDAAALRRLKELEEVPSSRPAADVMPVRPDAAAPSATEHPDADLIPPPSVVPPPSVRAPAGQRWWRRARWAGSIVATALLTIAVSWTLIQPIGVDPQGVGAPQVARLREDPGIDLPVFFDNGGLPGSSRAFREFNGLQIAVGPDAFGQGGGDQCISVIDRSDLESATDNSFGGPIYSACGANAFAASIVIIVTADMPRRLRDEFAEGTALQFVYDERRSDVVVFSSPE